MDFIDTLFEFVIALFLLYALILENNSLEF